MVLDGFLGREFAGFAQGDASPPAVDERKVRSLPRQYLVAGDPDVFSQYSEVLVAGQCLVDQARKRRIIVKLFDTEAELRSFSGSGSHIGEAHNYHATGNGRERSRVFGELVGRLKSAGRSDPGFALWSSGIRQDGRTSSMLKAIALAITCFLCFAFENLNKRFICPVLEEFALLVNLAEQAIGDLHVFGQDHQLPGPAIPFMPFLALGARNTAFKNTGNLRRKISLKHHRQSTERCLTVVLDLLILTVVRIGTARRRGKGSAS